MSKLRVECVSVRKRLATVLNESRLTVRPQVTCLELEGQVQKNTHPPEK